MPPEPSDVPMVGAPRGPVLMSAANPNGWKLEELLRTVRDELREQVRTVTPSRTRNLHGARTLAVLDVVIGLLAQAETLVSDGDAVSARIANVLLGRGTPEADAQGALRP